MAFVDNDKSIWGTGYQGKSLKPCEKCLYFDKQARCCIYNLIEGHSRGCLPGRGCKVRKTGNRRKYLNEKRK